MSALLHESIHNYLYMVEAEYPFSVDINRLHNFTAQSAWSGRTLPLASFVHAVFVWFGLSQMWHQVQARDAHPDATQEYIAAARGFLNPSYRETVESLAERVRPDILDMFRQFQEVIQSQSTVRA